MTTVQRKSSSAVFAIKRGNSLVLGCSARRADGAPFDLTGCTVAAHARRGGQLVAVLVVDFVDAVNGQFELSAPGDTTTADWPLGVVDVDIAYVHPTSTSRRVVQSTDTFFIHVLPTVTEVAL